VASPFSGYCLFKEGEKRKEYLVGRQLFFLADRYAIPFYKKQLRKPRILQLRVLFNRPRKSICIHFWLSFGLVYKNPRSYRSRIASSITVSTELDICKT